MSLDLFKTQKLCKFYNKKYTHAQNANKWIVFMADGKILHGGLSDRLCGILSMYAYAKKCGYEFKILFNSPYSLTDILIPNRYNWVVTPDELSYNSDDSMPVYLSVWSEDNDKVVKYVDSRLRKIDKKQIHIYTNTRYFTKEMVPTLFEELFKPCPMLHELLVKHLSRLKNDYVSLTFRFQQLLGDFKEGNFETLNSDKEKKELISRCLKVVDYLHKMFADRKILVTSDSRLFLERAGEFSYVYVVNGAIRHMDFTDGEIVDISVDMKSYIDMLLIANAKEIYLCNIPPLYRSGFPQTSSYIYNRPYYEIQERESSFVIVKT